MKSLHAIAAAVLLTASLLSASDSYSIDVTITKSKSNDQCDFAAVVSELADDDGDVHETTIAKPRVITTPGSPGSFYVGSCAEPDSRSVSMEVSWPEYEAHGVVICTVTVKRGERVVARSRMKATLATSEHETAEPIAPREPPPRVSVSDAPGDRTLGALPAPDSGGGR